MDWVLLGHRGRRGARQFTDLNFATGLWAWIAFLATFLILRKVAWPIFLRKMEEREIRIAEGLQKAEEAEARARELMEKQEQILEEARQEAQKFLAESRAQAENVKNDLLAAGPDRDRRGAGPGQEGDRPGTQPRRSTSSSGPPSS